MRSGETVEVQRDKCRAEDEQLSEQNSQQERVSLQQCAPGTADADVVRVTEETIAALGDLGEAGKRLRAARTVAVKINAGIQHLRQTEGHQTELTDPAVIEGTLRVLRQLTDAEIIVGDAPTDDAATEIYAALDLPARLGRIPGVRLHDFNRSELVEVEMSHPGALFRRYSIPREIAQADATVSIAKMKAHTSLGCTLCIKNLFGWMPVRVYGAPRMYLHDRLIRLPRVLSDLAQWLQPCLNVVDGIVAANKSEWGGEALKPGVLLAGTNCVAVDATGARVMGFDPQSDYPIHPFLYRRNTVRLAAEAGLGPLDEITVVGHSPESVVTPFTVHGYDDKTPRADAIRRRNEAVRHGAACVARYRERQAALAKQYGTGRFLALTDGDVLFDGPDMASVMRWEHETKRDWRNVPQFVVRVLPPEEEIEDFGCYEREATELPE